jgi:3-methylfumaryl-CoA hydratase
MSKVDLEYLRTWVGKEVVDDDVLGVRHARLMAATLDLSQQDVRAGAPMQPLWHWLYFLQGLPPSELGRDSHPARGGFLPPVPLSNRMWAGGQLEFAQPLRLGAHVRKRSSVVSVDHKQGRTGDLVFVTVRHEVDQDGRPALTELHDIVFKDPTPPTASASVDEPARPTPTHVEQFTPDSTTLFRYSALTFNGHRIHYDHDYCREVEGYPNPVIHGPLNATLLAMLAQRVAGKPLRRFKYRGLRPALLGQTLRLEAAPDPEEGDGLLLWAVLANGQVCMQASANF